MGSTMAVLPIRFSPESKNRLRNLLNKYERITLVRAMLGDTIKAVTDATLIDSFALVTPDAQFLGDAPQPVFELHRSETTGLNEELTAYVNILHQKAVQSVIIILPDLPLLTGRILDEMITVGTENQRPVIAPDWRRLGTNILFFPLPPPIQFTFGDKSCQKHLASFAAVGLNPITYFAIETALDIDDEAALQRFFLSARSQPAWQATITYRTLWVDEKKKGKFT
jgi:2-phospho-L-lactate guanylyltransferase